MDLGLPVNALYQVNQNSLTAPLVQTDPRFIGNRNWLSSDFLIRQFQDTSGLAPGYRRFGDGFYEQQLIQRQIQDATGQRYLTGFNSNEAQYLALMQAGLQQAQVQRYVLGIALSDTQIAQLKTDLVWLVKRSVTLADGSTEEVLVPQVYLQPSSVQVTGRQTLIAGNELAFQTVQDILNKGGTLAARRGVSLRADRIGNLGGRITGGDIRLAATTDIDNAGHIDAEQGLVMTAGRDIAINSTRASSANRTTTGSNINQIASVSGEQVVIAAGRDLIANAAVIAARGDASLAAGRDVSLGSVTEEFRQDIRWGNGGRGLTGTSSLVREDSTPPRLLMLPPAVIFKAWSARRLPLLLSMSLAVIVTARPSMPWSLPCVLSLPTLLAWMVMSLSERIRPRRFVNWPPALSMCRAPCDCSLPSVLSTLAASSLSVTPAVSSPPVLSALLTFSSALPTATTRPLRLTNGPALRSRSPPLRTPCSLPELRLLSVLPCVSISMDFNACSRPWSLSSCSLEMNSLPLAARLPATLSIAALSSRRRC